MDKVLAIILIIPATIVIFIPAVNFAVPDWPESSSIRNIVFTPLETLRKKEF